jgi:large subunit ribosomal protein L9
MKVILRENYEPLGKSGTVLEVKDGYARNYLIPRGIVYPATPKYQRMLEEEERLRKKREVFKVKNAQELADALSKATVIAKRKAGEEGRLFGSVTSQDIADLLAEQGIEVDKRKIVMDEPIRLLGTYQVRVHLHQDVEALLQVSVVKEEEEEEKK